MVLTAAMLQDKLPVSSNLQKGRQDPSTESNSECNIKGDQDGWEAISWDRHCSM